MDSAVDTYVDLFLGYSAIWLIIAFCLLRLMREQSRQRAELKNAAELLKTKDSESSA